MKKITTLIVLAIAGINLSFAQTPAIFGTCYNGGSSNWGAIFQANIDGSNMQTVYSFLNPEGAMPWGRIAQAPNGKIYGVTFLGGCSDSCTMYEYDPIAHTCIDVYDFFCTPPSGEPSQGGVTLLPDGKLYGFQQNGIMYKFDPNTHVYTLLNQGSASYMGGVMQASDGNLYGVSYGYGANNQGFIFRYDLTAQTYTMIYSFDGDNGGHPYYVNLIQGTNGKLYGTTYDGGVNTKGVLFSYDLTTNSYTDLHDFNTTTGGNPYAGVIQATNGKLYGMTYLSGTSNNGVIYSYDIATSQYAVIYNFDGTNGSHPQRTLTQASNGKLFGTTYDGGLYSAGIAFSYDIATSTFTKLTDFTTAMGSHPQCDIQEASLPIETGISSANALSMSIYVNASNQLIVRNAGDKGELTVYDALGKNVFQSTLVNQKSEVDMSLFQRGIYFVQLKAGGEINTQKIILAK